MGEVQAEVTKQMIFERFGIDTIFSELDLIYKETPCQIGEGYASYSGSSAVGFVIEPLKRESGLVFENKLSASDFLPKFAKQSKKLVKDYCNSCLLGWELVDCKITLNKGMTTKAGSNASHFNVAVPIALFRALKNADTKMLEPYNNFKLSVPNEYYQSVVSLLPSTSINDVIFEKEQVIISGIMKAKLCTKLQKELFEHTKGRALISFQFHSYIETDIKIENKFRYLDPTNKNILFKINFMNHYFYLTLLHAKRVN